MDVLSGAEGIDHRVIPGEMCHQPKLDLAVVRIHDAPAFPGQERLADLSAFLSANRDILQVGFRRRDPAGRRARLIKIAVHAPLRIHQRQQAFNIRPVQLGQLTVAQQRLNHLRRSRSEVLKHLHRRGVPAAGLFPVRQLQVFKQDIAQLLGAVDVENAHAAGVIDGLLQPLNLPGIAHAELSEEIPVHAEPDILHPEEHKGQRKLDFLHEPHHALLLHHLFLPYSQGEKAGGITGHFPADIPESIALFLGIEQVGAQHDVPVKGCRDRFFPLAQKMQQALAVMHHGGVCAEFFGENAEHLVRIQPGMQQIAHQLHAGRSQIPGGQCDLRIRQINRQRTAAFGRNAQERPERIDAFDFLTRRETQHFQLRCGFLLRLFLGS